MNRSGTISRKTTWGGGGGGGGGGEEVAYILWKKNISKM